MPCCRAALAALILLVLPTAARAQTAPASDLDDFMARVLARRDDNWKRIQQYVLDERERLEVNGPAGERIYGLERDFTWYMRDGIFVRSPVRVNGAAVDEREREKAEASWIASERASAGDKSKREPATASSGGSSDLDTVLQLAREPKFVSLAYFLKFKFEPGHYAFAGPEQIDGVRVLRIEYYPEQLFRDDEEDQPTKEQKRPPNETESRINRQMNKTALVTLWIEPSHEQIVRYTFENIGMDFLPGRSVIRVEGVFASMQMVEAFRGVWLPRRVTGGGEATLASGTYRATYEREYHDYREAEVKSRVVVR
jgi:hypothetical protein